MTSLTKVTAGAQQVVIKRAIVLELNPRFYVSGKSRKLTIFMDHNSIGQYCHELEINMCTT